MNINHLSSYLRTHPRMACALAFGTITTAVQYFAWLPDMRMSGSVPVLTIGIGLTHAIAGAITGPRLVDASRTCSLSQGGLLGGGTSLLALVLFAPLFTTFMLVTEIHAANLFTYVSLPFLVAVFAFLGGGWALFLLSIAVGSAVYWLAVSRQLDNEYESG